MLGLEGVRDKRQTGSRRETLDQEPGGGGGDAILPGLPGEGWLRVKAAYGPDNLLSPALQMKKPRWRMNK